MMTSSIFKNNFRMSFFSALIFSAGLHAVLWSHIGILLLLHSAEPRSTAGFLFPSQSLSGMIWLTPYLMVWDWLVSRAGPMHFCWPSCSLLFCLKLFSLSLLFLYRLVVWGWGLRTGRVSISLSRPCIANLVLIIIIIYFYFFNILFLEIVAFGAKWSPAGLVDGLTDGDEGVVN